MDNLIKSKHKSPLADFIRPAKIEDIYGQEHVLAEGGILYKMLSSSFVFSFILWGPPGVGKTTIAKIFAKELDAEFISISAVFSSVVELKAIFKDAKERKDSYDKKTILFVDEIHRFNKSQQDSFLQYIEDGTIILIGATTENPSFYINNAILSRVLIIELNLLDRDSLLKIYQRAKDNFGKQELNTDILEFLIEQSGGDGRYFINLLEQVFLLESGDLTLDKVTKILHKRKPNYDKASDNHYVYISALHKSVRGSDVQASLYWFYRMIDSGEEPLYLARRLIRIASEDVGLADPQAMVICNSAWDIYQKLGHKEGVLAIAEAVVYLALAPKSNSLYVAEHNTLEFAQKTSNVLPSKHIINAPNKTMKDLGFGKGYVYDHDEEYGFSGQDFLPESFQNKEFFIPKNIGYERELKKRIEFFKKLKKLKQDAKRDNSK